MHMVMRVHACGLPINVFVFFPQGMHVHIDACVLLQARVRVNMCVRRYVPMHMHIYLYIYMFAFMNNIKMCVCVCVCVSVS